MIALVNEIITLIMILNKCSNYSARGCVLPRLYYKQLSMHLNMNMNTLNRNEFCTIMCVSFASDVAADVRLYLLISWESHNGL